jgi:RNA polymerase sigma-70 factor (ECF subfamily)
MTGRTFQTLAQAAENYYDELRRFILRRTGSLAIAEDVVQETWIRASTSGVAMPDNPRAYLYRMAGNLAIDHLRRRERTDAWLEEDGGDSKLDHVADNIPAPDDVVAARQEWDILTQAVEDLPEKCRAVFLLYRGRGLTMRQTAATLGISEKTVEKHIARAMLHCRQRLRDAGRDV